MNIIQLESHYKKTNELQKIVKYKNFFSFQLIKIENYNIKNLIIITIFMFIFCYFVM